MRCRGANVTSCTWLASTAASSSSSNANNGTCFNTSGLHAIEMPLRVKSESLEFYSGHQFQSGIAPRILGRGMEDFGPMPEKAARILGQGWKSGENRGAKVEERR